jgi:hypothetical protein
MVTPSCKGVCEESLFGAAMCPAGGMAQVVEGLHSKHKALSSNPSTRKQTTTKKMWDSFTPRRRKEEWRVEDSCQFLAQSKRKNNASDKEKNQISSVCEA